MLDYPHHTNSNLHVPVLANNWIIETPTIYLYLLLLCFLTRVKPAGTNCNKGVGLYTKQAEVALVISKGKYYSECVIFHPSLPGLLAYTSEQPEMLLVT